MSGRRYKQGTDRQQTLLLPPSLDDYVSANNPVRAIDAYVSTLHLEPLSFHFSKNVIHSGQPAYNPADLLKLYLYGYLNQVRSSRKLERETYRNLEVIWLLCQQHPCYKTIANFRKDNAKALQQVNRDFVLLCQELDLYGGKQVAIDGSFFKGNASKGSIVTEGKLKKQLARLDKQVLRYQQALARNDQIDQALNQSNDNDEADLKTKLQQLQEYQRNTQAELESLQKSDQKQRSRTDSDARLLSKSGQLIAGYNIQAVIDDKHHLLVNSDVTNEGNDQRQLYRMALQTKEILTVSKLTVLADAGYYQASQIKDCIDANITPYVPEPNKSRHYDKQQRYPRENFYYDKQQDAYRCPQGQILKRQSNLINKASRKEIRYCSQASVCGVCIMKTRCLTKQAKTRQIYRWEYEEILDAHRVRMATSGKQMKQRSALVEHPFGTLKDRAGWACHFLVRGFKKVRGEWSLMSWGYNFTRVLNIMGIQHFIDYCKARQQTT